ncbi:hypothetical protein D3C76_1015270 [compost metagenome]
MILADGDCRPAHLGDLAPEVRIEWLMRLKHFSHRLEVADFAQEAAGLVPQHPLLI